MSGFWCELAWIDDAPVKSVALDCDRQGLIEKVQVGADPGTRQRLTGLVIPGLANCHSHVFHRSLRGQAESGGDFWAWRESMYRVADTLEPDSLFDLAKETYREMVESGFTAVGEFHYLHNRPGGRPYEPSHQMTSALQSAAAGAGIRLTILVAAYFHGGIGKELTRSQSRFSDQTPLGTGRRFEHLATDSNTRKGGAIHSLRTVTPTEVAELLPYFADHPFHIHVSEQPAENRATETAYQGSPINVLNRIGALSSDSTLIHAIHTTSDDIELVRAAGSTVCACPTTEADLGDGIGPFRAMSEVGVPLVVGSDQNTRIDPFEEVQRLELDQRLATGRRQLFTGAELIKALTIDGYRSLGWPEGGEIAPGRLCDLVAIRLDSRRTKGTDGSMIPMVARSDDVVSVVVGGRVVVPPAT